MQFSELERRGLTETARILSQSGLSLHPAVGRVSLEGSRGLQDNFRPDSDLDLSLILRPGVAATAELCQAVLAQARESWRSEVELDLAVIFDRRGCGLKCFDVTHHDPGLCDQGVDCMGIYKDMKGFNGFLEGLGLEVRLMYPALTIWTA